MTDLATTTLLTHEERLHAVMVKHCDNCAELAEQGTPWSEIQEAHDLCHGWYHCECCGGCPTCYVEYDIFADLEAWEKALND